MNRFWDIVIKPCLQAIEAKKIVEIGSDRGIGTQNIIEYCKQVQGEAISVDPFPKYDYKEWEKEYEGLFKLYADLSLSRLPLLDNYDAILIDGDHNWYTVYNELKIVQKTFDGRGLPLIFIHDIDWPYGRRDLYYNPDNIPAAYRQAYAKKGVLPDQLNLVDEGGLNDHLYNAIYENNIKNGVFTAIEDFIKEYPKQEEIGFLHIAGIFGLGIIYNKHKHKEIPVIIEGLHITNSVRKRVEFERIKGLIENKELIKKNKQLAVQANALKEEKRILEEKNYVLQQEKNSSLNNIFKQDENSKSILKIKLAEIETNLEEILLENNQLKNILKEKEQRITKLTIDNRIHLNSVRYNLGDIIIKGIRPSIDTIKMPIRILKLLIQGIRKRQTRKKKIDNCPDQDKDNLKENYKQIKCLARSLTQIEADKKHLLDIYTGETLIGEMNTTPLISIIVVNRNGEHHLKTFFDSIVENVNYKAIEIIMVDNASQDRSLEVIKRYQSIFNIQIIKNTYNETYSNANNQGAKIAKGEYLLFANNDIQVYKGWLEALLSVCLNNSNAGAVGSLLFYPECPKESINKDKSFTIQHCGIKFHKNEDRIIPYNYLNGKSPKEALKDTTSIAGITGASLMIDKNKFFQVGGFTGEYIYGYEDVGLSLKLLKKGYTNYIVPSSKAFHFEFGTQDKQSAKDVSKRRLHNIQVFKRKWQSWLEKQYIEAIFTGDSRFFDKKIKVAFAVTEAGENVSAGDYFTAMEFGEAMKNRGWEIEFLKRKGPEDWYQVSDDVDIVIALLDVYDVRKIRCNNKNLITIAWARNWFERWANQPFIGDYTYVAASSEIACQYMKEIIGKEVGLLKIASNRERFASVKMANETLKCDYCFTGSYWNDPREIIDMLNPDKHSEYKFNIYGANWDKIDKFKPYNKGFVEYATMPQIYASTKIVIDDANRVTKPFGSVNSRVFDALASGVLVLTNGILGAELTFNNLVPTFTNEQELNKHLTYYLTHEKERLELVEKLQEQVLTHHTYDNRVDELLDLLGYTKPKKTILIKTPVPRVEIAEEWGDYHFALALVREFEKLGFEAKYQYLSQWDADDSDIDVVMVLRGLSKYAPKDYHYNIMWNISHPDKITMEEYYAYDQVYIASELWTKEVQNSKLNEYTKVDTLLQCADINVFKPVQHERDEYELLFVGNSRKVYRKVIKDLLPTPYDLAVYGTNWTDLISKEYIKGENIPNVELFKHYGIAKIVLNDHWDDMREKGFISNRIFDVLASKGFIISDEVQGLEKYFGDAIVTYKDKEDLKEKIELYINDEDKRQKSIEEGYKVVIKNHTFEQRAKQIISSINV
jgi:GT2 family glycosyltransferase/spore maturation protein CgeB